MQSQQWTQLMPWRTQSKHSPSDLSHHEVRGQDFYLATGCGSLPGRGHHLKAGAGGVWLSSWHQSLERSNHESHGPLTLPATVVGLVPCSKITISTTEPGVLYGGNWARIKEKRKTCVYVNVCVQGRESRSVGELTQLWAVEDGGQPGSSSCKILLKQGRRCEGRRCQAAGSSCQNWAAGESRLDWRQQPMPHVDCRGPWMKLYTLSWWLLHR